MCLFPGFLKDTFEKFIFACQIHFTWKNDKDFLSIFIQVLFERTKDGRKKQFVVVIVRWNIS